MLLSAAALQGATGVLSGAQAPSGYHSGRREISEYRINERIKANMVRLVSAEGEQLGILARSDAILMAQEKELDLVEVAPQADPPVCKLLDYGKFKYHQKKKKQGQKNHQTKLKEIQIGMSTAEHDLTVKAGRVREFLKERDKVVVTMRLKGRQRAHMDIAVAHMAAFGARFDDIAKIENGPESGGAGRVTMLLTPK